MARTFDGVDDEVVCALGNCPDSPAGITFVVVWKPAAVAAQGLIFVNDGPGGGGNVLWSVNPYVDGVIYFGSSGFSALGSYTATDGWRIDVISKAAGNSTVRHSVYLFDSPGWSHTNYGTVDDNTPGMG